MTEHEIRTEKLLLEVLRGTYFLLGLLADKTNNPNQSRTLERDLIGVYFKMYAELSTQVLKENPDLYQKLMTDYKVD
jgi:hypothetical protein